VGDAKVTGQTFLAEVDTRLADKESIVSLLVMRGEWDAKTARGYATGGGNDISRGQTDIATTTVRAVRCDGPTQKFIPQHDRRALRFVRAHARRTDAFASRQFVPRDLRRPHPYGQGKPPRPADQVHRRP
jgi:hypothetical protein